eukprot:CAMPEP_0194294464 /NCGR_PEP_ID=MMETSP0169-20130528/50717_1 /TAXON_ID=218684 /ORGANISM="Corethron pennatum, Strain L29A3" /LENGTH=446 /DNA_ID=CAMNT_0039043321 /DNA_START=287 /DNA_END=1627 /DNA_ORIENTATION=-
MPSKIPRNKTKIPENNIKPLLFDANTPKIPTASVHTFLYKTQQQKTRNNSIGMVPKKKMDLWVKDYIDFHNSAIEDGKLKDGFPYVIYVCSKNERCGGVGDRVLGMVKAFYFAMMEGRVLLIESEFPVSLKYYLNPNLVQWDAEFPQTETVLDTMGKGATRDYINKYADILGYYFERCNGDKVKKLSDIMKDKQMLNLKKKYVGKKVHQAKSIKFNNEYSSAFHQAFWTLFKFDDVILSRAKEMKQGAGLALLKKNVDAPIRSKEMMVPYVGLHNRQGDHLIPGVKTTNRLQRKTVTTQLLECYHTLKRHFPGEYQAAYIASDNYEAKEGMKKMDNTIHYPPEMEIFHVDLSTRKEGNPKMHEEEVRRGFIDTWAEVVVLIDSDCLIISRSMFSTLAYYIRDDRETCNVHILDCDDDSAVASRTNIYRMDPLILVYTPWKKPKYGT